MQLVVYARQLGASNANHMHGWMDTDMVTQKRGGKGREEAKAKENWREEKKDALKKKDAVFVSSPHVSMEHAFLCGKCKRKCEQHLREQEKDREKERREEKRKKKRSENRRPAIFPQPTTRDLSFFPFSFSTCLSNTMYE